MSTLGRGRHTAMRSCTNGHVQSGRGLRCEVCGEGTGACCPLGHPAPLDTDVCATCGHPVQRDYPPLPPLTALALRLNARRRRS